MTEIDIGPVLRDLIRAYEADPLFLSFELITQALMAVARTYQGYDPGNWHRLIVEFTGDPDNDTFEVGTPVFDTQVVLHQ